MVPSAGSKRQTRAERNDRAILASAHAVFVADPSAPIAAVAKHAGVGISALYRRYPSKEVLLRTLCADGLQRYTDLSQAALALDALPWERFSTFMTGAVDADASGLTRRLAGTFTPTPQLEAAAAHAGELTIALFDAAREAGAIRADTTVNDVALILEQLASIQLGDQERTRALRRRYLQLALDGLRATPDSPLPASAPTDAELGERWTPSA